MITLSGYCPMGCGTTLFVGEGGFVTCSNSRCSNPSAVADILGDPVTEHVVELGAHAFSVQHPLAERINGDLFECTVHSDIADLAGPPADPGRYTVAYDGGVRSRGLVFTGATR